jgi:hypothetical protein
LTSYSAIIKKNYDILPSSYKEVVISVQIASIAESDLTIHVLDFGLSIFFLFFFFFFFFFFFSCVLDVYTLDNDIPLEYCGMRFIASGRNGLLLTGIRNFRMIVAKRCSNV